MSSYKKVNHKFGFFTINRLISKQRKKINYLFVFDFSTINVFDDIIVSRNYYKVES